MAGYSHQPDFAQRLRNEPSNLAQDYSYADPRKWFILLFYPSSFITSEPMRRRTTLFCVMAIYFLSFSLYGNITIGYEQNRQQPLIKVFHTVLNVLILLMYFIGRTRFVTYAMETVAVSCWIVGYMNTVALVRSSFNEFLLISAPMQHIFVPAWMFFSLIFLRVDRVLAVVTLDVIGVLLLPVFTGAAYGYLLRYILFHGACGGMVIIAAIIHHRDLIQLASVKLGQMPEREYEDFFEAWAKAGDYALKSHAETELAYSGDSVSYGPNSSRTKNKASASQPTWPKPPSNLALTFNYINILFFHPTSDLQDRWTRRRARAFSGIILYLGLVSIAWVSVHRELGDVDDVTQTYLGCMLGAVVLFYFLSRTKAARTSACCTVAGVCSIPYFVIFNSTQQAGYVQSAIPLTIFHTSLASLVAVCVLEGWEQFVFALLILFPSLSSPIAPTGFILSLSVFVSVNGLITWLDARDVNFKQFAHPIAYGKDFGLGAKSFIMTKRTVVWVMTIITGCLVSVLLFLVLSTKLRHNVVTMVPDPGNNIVRDVYFLNLTNNGEVIASGQDIIFETYNTHAVWRHEDGLGVGEVVQQYLKAHEFFPPFLAADVVVDGVSVLPQIELVVINFNSLQVFAYPPDPDDVDGDDDDDDGD